ncbi:MAG: phenylacetate--CoA ligase family protein [Chloroflexi bacterium]|nr:MAG: phenylacetate--CoA ligase family protein [Chloroflexota bacterium]
MQSGIARLARQLRWSAYLARQTVGEAAFPFRSEEAIRRMQSRRVTSMVAHAYQTVPYYRETMDRLGLTPDDLTSAEDLARLPVLERDQLQRDPEYFLSAAQPQSAYAVMRSSGSTGSPLTVFWDWKSWFTVISRRERYRSMVADLVGRRFGYRETVITAPGGSPREGERIGRALAYVPQLLRPKRQHLSLGDPPTLNIKLITQHQPEVIASYGSYLAALFGYLQSHPGAFHQPKAVVFGGDALTEASRRLISEGFRIPVFELYQAVEAQPIAFGCAHESVLHVNVDCYPVRVVGLDGRALPLGEVGEVVVSNLENRATVVLNYRIGDVAALLPGRCGCGRNLPLLSPIQGRSDEWVEVSNGRRIHPQMVCVPFRGEDEVWQFQVVQLAPDQLCVDVVSATSTDREALGRNLLQRFRSTIGEQASVEIRFVEAIAPGPSGKVRAVVSRLRDQ